MASYYYLIAQLPTILPNSEPPISFNEFKLLALRYLNKKDAGILEKLSLEPPRQLVKTGSSFLDTWYEFERALRLALEEARAAKLNWTRPSSYEERLLLSSAFSPVQIARTALSIQNPLEAEAFLDRARFAASEIKKETTPFSSDEVFSYAIKLLLRERSAKFKVTQGREEYSNIYNSILKEKEEN